MEEWQMLGVLGKMILVKVKRLEHENKRTRQAGCRIKIA